MSQPKDDIDFIEDEIVKEKKQKSIHERILTSGKKIIVKSGLDVAKEQFKKAKQTQNANIANAKRNIKSYKLLKKQARNTWKLAKLASKK